MFLLNSSKIQVHKSIYILDSAKPTAMKPISAALPSDADWTGKESKDQISSTLRNLGDPVGKGALKACFAVTLMKAENDNLKHLAQENTARMYHDLGPFVKSFLAVTSDFPEAVEMWRAAGNTHMLHGIESNIYGTPLFRSIIQQLEASCPSDVPFVGYANADILFDMQLVYTLEAIQAWAASKNSETLTESKNLRLMISGQRSNHNLKARLLYHDISKQPSELFEPYALDYFIMTRDLIDWTTIPDYVIGRKGYDNGLNDWAFHRNLLLDATNTILALHQTTATGNFAGSRGRRRDPEKAYNVKLPNATYDHGLVTMAQFKTYYDLDSPKSIVIRNMNTNSLIWPQQQR